MNAHLFKKKKKKLHQEVEFWKNEIFLHRLSKDLYSVSLSKQAHSYCTM